MRLLVAVMTLALVAPARAGDGPWGLVVHTPFQAEALHSIGVQLVRFDLHWRSIERAPGVYDFTAADKLVSYHLAHGFRVLAILNIADSPPFVPAHFSTVVAAASSFAGATARHFRGRGVTWELGNEPEVFSHGGLWRVPEQYSAVAASMARAIDLEDPAAPVAALSTAWMDRNFIARALEAGLLAGGRVDVVTYHGYHRHPGGDRLVEDLAWLRATLDRYSPDRRISIIDSERGYALQGTVPKSWAGWRNVVLTEEEQAAHLARHCLESLHAGADAIVWYKDFHGERGYSLFFGAPALRQLRPMGLVYRSLAKLLPEPPAALHNDRFVVTLRTDLPREPDPNGTWRVRTFLRRDRLLVALWNPVEAFGDRVLDSRRRIGDEIVDTWRPRTSDDRVDLPIRVQVHGLSGAAAMRVHDLLGGVQPLEFAEDSGGVLSAPFTAGSFPRVLEVELPD